MYRYCPFCSSFLEPKDHDQKKRYCPNCDKYIYQHTPQTTACVVLNSDKQILLVRRKYEPFKGLWSLPAGFVEYGENPINAGIRELKEETNLDAQCDKIVGIYLADDHPKTFSILTVILTKGVSGKAQSQDDTSELRYFDPNKLPDMAFKAQVKAIETFLNFPVV